MLRKLLSRTGLAILSIAVASSAFAQSAGSLRGTVSDSTGAVVPGATVTLTNQATKFTRNAVTDGTGSFYFATVDRGDYTLRVEIAGFKTYEATDVRVSANVAAGVDVTLEVGEMTETLTVTADREMITQESGTREGLITPEAIESLSIVGRNPTELLRILPGVVAPNQSSFEEQGMGSGFGGTGQSFSINGTRPEQLGITLDGANLRDIGNNSSMMNVPNNEFVAEVKVQVSNYAAEFGTNAINVQAVTKSGSSEFHGSAYWYNRHYKLAANDRSRSLIGNPRPESKFNYPGFTLSGPILFPGFNKERDKAFFFIGYEWAKQSLDTGAAFSVVPTAGQRAGLFNDYQGGQNLNQPTTVNIPFGYPNAGSPAPNNDLRPYMTPTGQALIDIHPDPNFNDPNNRYNYVFDELSVHDREQGIGRFDFNLSDSTKAYIRVARDKDTNEWYRGLWWNVGNVATPTPLDYQQIGVSAVANLTSVLSPTTTNEFIFSFSRLTNDSTWQDPSLVQKSTYGITDNVNPFGDNGQIPEWHNQFAADRGGQWYAQDVPLIFAYNGFLRFTDNFTKVLNTHAIKAGLIVERQYKEQNFQHGTNITYQFAPWANGTTGNDYGDLLVGRPAVAEVGQPSAIGEFVAWNYEAYLQDSWKVNKNLTLEYGLRFGKWTNNAEVNGLGAIFHPEDYDQNAGLFLDAERQQANGFRYARTGQVPNKLRDDRPLLWMPRVNFAWDVSGNGDTIIRGGMGIFYTREQGNAQYDIINLPPNSYRANLDSYALSGLGNGGVGCTPGTPCDGGLTYSTIGSADPFGALAGFDALSLNPNNLVWPKTTNASISVARRIPWQNTLEVGYVGSWGRNLTAQQQYNVLPIGTLSNQTLGNADMSNPQHRWALQGNVFDTLRPFPAYTNVRYNENVGRTNYHSLQVTLSRQAGDFQYLVAWTMGRNFGTVANDNGTIDPHDPRRSEGVVRSDRRHTINASWTLRLGQPASGGFAAALLNDWNLSGISTFATGTPIRIGYSGELGGDAAARAWWGTQNFQGNNDNGGFGPIAPVFTCDPTLGGNVDVGEKILDIGCISIPAFGTEGDVPSPPYDLRSPNRSFHDLTVFKDFQLGGSKRLQFRVGIFNLFNQAYPDPLQNDIDLTLQTDCNVRVNGVPNGVDTSDNQCDPTGGFHFTDNTLANFGKVITKRGHRVIELAVRFFF